jgi:hypothetical protein
VDRPYAGLAARGLMFSLSNDLPVSVKIFVAILLVAAAPVCAQAQSMPRVSKDDAQRVVKIISGDQAKTQSYCDIDKLGEQVEQAYEKNDSKMVAELSDKIEVLEKTLGPEYAALVDGLNQLDPQNKADIISEFTALNMLCRPEPPRY